jgi:hypothetical protein
MPPGDYRYCACSRLHSQPRQEGARGRPQGVVVGVITLKTASTFVIWHADPDVPKSHLKLDSNMWHLLYGGSTDPPPSPLFAQARLRRDLFGSS